MFAAFVLLGRVPAQAALPAGLLTGESRYRVRLVQLGLGPRYLEGRAVPAGPAWEALSADERRWLVTRLRRMDAPLDTWLRESRGKDADRLILRGRRGEAVFTAAGRRRSLTTHWRLCWTARTRGGASRAGRSASGARLPGMRWRWPRLGGMTPREAREHGASGRCNRAPRAQYSGMLRAAFTLLVLLAPAARGAECAAFGKLGCYYVPPEAGRSPALIVYLRGHYGEHKGEVPASRCRESARDAFRRYGLGATADSAGAAVLVTCSSHLGVRPEDLARLEAAAGVRFSRRALAAHSGGFVGLEKSLDAGLPAERLLMLDDFYFGPELARKVQQRVAAGATCAGFYTEHNRERYQSWFRPHAHCEVEARDDYGHDDAVVTCLGEYLTKPSCPPAP